MATLEKQLSAVIDLNDPLSPDDEEAQYNPKSLKQSTGDPDDNERPLEDAPVKKKNKYIRRIKKFKYSQLVVKGIQPAAKLLSLFDFATDIYLIYKVQQTPNLIWVLVIMLVSVLSPYLIAYSCGVQLYLNRGVFDKFAVKSIWFRFIMLLYLLPTGILYYIFLDFYFTLANFFYIWPSYTIFCIHDPTKLQQKEISIAKLVGMSLMDFEGYKKLRTITQLMFETIPQAILQSLMWAGIINLAGSTVSQQDIIMSLVSAGCNMIIQFSKVAIEAKGFDEPIISYSLKCMMGRFGWIPFLKYLTNFTGDKELILSYDKIKVFKLFTVSYYFSSITVRKLIDTLMDISSTNTAALISFTFGKSCDFVDIHSMVQLLS
eukprot:252843_1